MTKERARKGLTVAGSLALLALAGWLLLDGSEADDALASSRNRLFICSETGKTFRQEITVDTSFPVVSPFTGRPTGFEAEFCYWTSDGGIKDEPTPVLVNSRMGKPGPTFCPDCGRLVVELNPRASLDRKAPPTRAEYAGASQAGKRDE